MSGYNEGNETGEEREDSLPPKMPALSEDKVWVARYLGLARNSARNIIISTEEEEVVVEVGSLTFC